MSPFLCFHFCPSAFPWARRHLLSQSCLSLRSADNTGGSSKGWMHWLGCGHWPREALVPWLQVLRRGAAPVEGHLPIFPQSAPAPAAPSMNTQQTVDVSRLPRQSRPLREPAQQRGDLHRSSPTVSVVGQQQGAGGGAAARRQQNQGRRLSAGRTVGADARLTPGNYQRGLVAPHNPQGMSTCPVISPGAFSAPENCTLEFGGRGGGGGPGSRSGGYQCRLLFSGSPGREASPVPPPRRHLPLDQAFQLREGKGVPAALQMITKP